jgi:hypothetical protein
VPSIEDNLKIKSGADEDTAIYCGQVKKAFYSYLLDVSGSNCNPSAYIACLDNASEFAERKSIAPLKFWLITDSTLFYSVSEKLRNNVFFRLRDRKNYRLYPEAALAYLNFIKNGFYNAIQNESRTDNNDDETTVSIVDISEKADAAFGECEQPKNARTIVEAVIEVLEVKNAALSIQQIYDEITSKQLYEFKAIKPINVLNVEIRSHCVGVDMPSRANYNKFFKISHAANGVAFYVLLDTKPNGDSSLQHFAWNNEVASTFHRWLLSQGKAENTAYSYSRSLKRLVALFTNEYSQAQKSLCASGGAKKFSELLETNPQYKEMNVTVHNQYSAAVGALSSFFKAVNLNNLPTNEDHQSSNTITSESGSSIAAYDWKSSPNIKGSKPISINFSTDSQAILTDSWKALLICTYEYAVKTFPYIDITKISRGKGRRKLCSYKGNEVSYAEKLKCGLYVDTAFSANDVVGIVRAIFELCGADVGGVEILYHKGDFDASQNNEKYNTLVCNLQEEEKNIITVFKEVFPYSMNLGFVDLSKLKTEYNSRFNASISLTDDAVYHLIRNNAVKTDYKVERYAHLDNLANPKVLTNIKYFINSEIGKGISRVYAKPIYEKFKENLGIAVNEDLLLTIVETAFCDEFKVNRKSMFVSSKGDELTLKIDEEIATAIVSLLQENVMPFSVDDISDGLPGYPRNRVAGVLSNNINKNGLVVIVEDSKYAYIDYVYISDEQTEQIRAIIAQGVKVGGYKVIEEMFAEIAETIPAVIELNPEISQVDIIKAIKHKIGSTYIALHGRFVPKKGSP